MTAGLFCRPLVQSRLGVFSLMAIAACSPGTSKKPGDAGIDVAGTGGTKPGTGGTSASGGVTGAGGVAGVGGVSGTAATAGTGGVAGTTATDAGRATEDTLSAFPDAAPDLANTGDLAGSTDLFAAPDVPSVPDVPIDESVAGVDGLAAADASNEAAPPPSPTTYYVAMTGSDSADGTLAAPFRTIQHCATLARPGDTCAMRAGTYRETVTPVRSGTADAHITFTAYNGECVTISGAEVLKASWQPYQGSIYVADTSLRFIQLFADGKMLNEARWPNADPDDLLHAPFAQAGPSTTATTLEGPTLPTGDWAGAYVFTIPGYRWVGYTRKIAGYDQVKKIATWTEAIPNADSGTSASYLPALQPRAGDTYYVFGSLLALDSPGEWFQDAASGKVYLWAPNSAAPSTVKTEVKQRDYGFNLGARSYIDVKGIRLFATSVRMAGASHCVVDGVHARYVSHLRETSAYQTGLGAGTWTPIGAGLVVNVSNPGGSTLRLNVQGPNGGSDPNDSWCVVLKTFDQPVFFPWNSFKTTCWATGGTAYAGQPLATVAILVPGGATSAVPYDFCINGMVVQMDATSPLEAAAWAVEDGGRVATSNWQGTAYLAQGGVGTTMTPGSFSALVAGSPLCVTGSLAATSDYSGWAMVGVPLNEGWYDSTSPVLDGDSNEWKNGSIAYSASEGLSASGHDGKIDNNVIHDVSYMGLDIGGITTYGGSARTTITNNTLTRSGSKGIRLHGTADHVLKNRVSQVMLQVDDGGLVYSWGTDSGGSEVAYNDLSDNQTTYATGVYLDDGARGFIAHHNLIRNTAGTGVSFKAVNQIFNNTILGTPAGAASVYLNQNTNVWEDLSTAVFSNNLLQQRPGVFISVEQSQTNDSGDYQTLVSVTADWQKVTIPFSALRQPTWAIPETFALTDVVALVWSVASQGAYEIDIDDLYLEGTTPKLLDDFDGAATNSLGGTWWTTSGQGSTVTKGTATGFAGKALSLVGAKLATGWSTAGTLLSPGGTPIDLSAYTGISFRIRGVATLNLSNGTASSMPIQQHNIDCPVDANGIPTSSCPVDQGGLFSPYTDGYAGAAPDVGAFESGKTPWTAGSTTVEPTDTCPQ